jgi:nucleoside-diphosphate-sugar epimerase
MITILGSGRVIANEMVKLLSEGKEPVRLVARNPRQVTGAEELVPADLTDKGQTINAADGSRIVVLAAGLKYDHKVWVEQWPRIMNNAMEACKRAHAKLIFFDNVYAYGKVEGAMTEETHFNPCSKKGEVRAKIASRLINEWKCEALTGMIVRAADFYGPDAPTGVANVLVFDPLAKKQKASVLVDDSMPHSYSYTPDAARSVVMLAGSESAWNQTWHVATAGNPPTGEEFAAMAAKEFGADSKYRVLSRRMVRLVGVFKPVVREIYEMLYQNDSPYLFDSSKFAKAFGFSGTPYAEGIRATAASYQKTTAQAAK